MPVLRFTMKKISGNDVMAYVNLPVITAINITLVDSISKLRPSLSKVTDLF